MYFQLYDIMAEAFYGSGIELTNYQDMVLTVLATAGILALVAIPFVLVYALVRMVIR